MMERIKRNIKNWSLTRNGFCAYVDFDGVVADTEPLHALTFQNYFQSIDIIFEQNLFARYIGNTEQVVFEMIARDQGVSIDISDAIKNRCHLFLELAESKDLKPYCEIVELLEHLVNLNGKLIMLSSQKKWVIHYLLEKWGLANLFDEIISVSDLNTNKTAVLKESVTVSGFAISDSIVVEDSFETAKLAEALGAYIVIVEHRFSSPRNLRFKNILRPSKIMRH